MALRNLVLACLVALCASSALRSTPAAVKVNATKVNATKVNATKSDDMAEVKMLREKLQKVSNGLASMLGPSGNMAGTEVAKSLTVFVAHVKEILRQTAAPKDVKNALKELKAAQASVKGLVKDMTVRQMRLMTEGNAQTASLLLGVLLTKKSEPMDKQLEVLKSDEFAKLPCVASILAAKDTKTPLFQQVAAYLDAHTPKSEQVPAIPNITMGKDGKPDVSPIVNALKIRLDHLEKSETRQAEVHADEMKDLDKAVAKAEKKNPKLAKRVKSMKKTETRKFQKETAITKNDIKSLKTAIVAIQKGDLKALQKSEDALQASIKSMQGKTGGFLYLIQLTHKMEKRDCPYCAAQCVDKCHVEGHPYVQCLTDCADAGKGK